MINGFSNKSSLEKNKKIVNSINEIKLTALSDNELLMKARSLQSKAQQGEALDDLLVDAFALVKEAVKRCLNIDAYDEQLMAAIAMHEGRIIEMQTGEGKTLTAVFTAYLNSLTGEGVHILTFNDYLAKRDALWMGPVYKMLGTCVSFVQAEMEKELRREAYASDITYVTAKIAGFDYLRDFLCYKKEDLIQRPYNFVIVDEADSIIIDEARIPLVIATGEYEKDENLFTARDVVKTLNPTVHYKKDEYERNVFLSEAGIKKVEELLCCDNLYDEGNFKILNEINNALHAEVLFRKDIDYIVRNNMVELIDEYTGRVAENRHWPDGLQAAVEAKESLPIQSKGRIMSQITLQSFIMLYKKISGMTATAKDSSEEIREFYGLDIVSISPHKTCIREDEADVIFTHKEAKYKALIEEIKKVNCTGQPILIGTNSVKESIYLAEQLKISDIECNILNAKNDEFEASIVEQAGVIGAVTVSTNMAGRGTDIKLGGIQENGKEKLKALGGLYVIGTNRHESCRIDKQLRGRAGRQGDPGKSKFFISLEDELIKQYGIDNIIPANIRPHNQEEPIENNKIAKKIEQVQRIIQGQISDIRRTLWKYSSVIENHRQQVHERRMEILKETSRFNILEKAKPELFKKMFSIFDEVTIREIEKQVTLYNIDNCWAIYLSEAAILQEGIHLNILGGKDPLREFQIETAELFNNMHEEIEASIIRDFENMEMSETGLNILRERLKPPSSTWTYLVNDNSFEDKLATMFLGVGSSGIAAASAGIFATLPTIFGTFFKKNRSKNNNE